MADNLPDDQAMLDLAKQARLAISYQAPFQQDSAFADWLTTAYKNGYNKGRSDCLQESLESKQLLPHELKLIARLLDLASDSYSNHGCNDFDLDDSRRMRDLIRKMLIASDPSLSDEDVEQSLRPHQGKLCVMDWMLMDYLADRVREMLAEEEG